MNIANRAKRECHRLAREMGGSIEVEEGRSGHPHLIVRYRELMRRVTLSNTPKDADAGLDHAKRKVKWAILEMQGVVR